MPQPGLPPTPASSTDIQGKDNVPGPQLEMSFTLPPPAMTSTTSNASSSVSINSDSSYNPVSPMSPTSKTTTQKPKRTSSGQRYEPALPANADFSLPPPPTRSRKIIQMKPGTSHSAPSTSSTRTDKRNNISPPFKKQPSASSVAGKKIARKTAHSLIERRRRSKMNEEFAVLKDMIPACHDQEMHKLAILQASIDYLRYLERCVADLKATRTHPSSIYQSRVPTPRPPMSVAPDEGDEDEDADEDLEMADSEAADVYPTPHLPTSITTSPTLLATHTSYDSLHGSDASTAAGSPHDNTHHHASSYSSTTSSLPSPAFPPQSYIKYAITAYQSQRSAHTGAVVETSPSLGPTILDADHEATTALLMLGGGGGMKRRFEDDVVAGSMRRGTDGGGGRGRGMSVQDLLSS